MKWKTEKQKINITKIWFFKKMNKIHKPPVSGMRKVTSL